MNREPVTSSNITSIGYDADKSILEIEFNTGKIYQYEPVTAEGHLEFMKSDSIGSFFHKHIRGNDTLTVTKID